VAKAQAKEKGYTLFLGCMVPLRHPYIEASARKTFENLGIDIADSEEFTCCPEPWSVKGSDLEAWLSIAMRNLAVGEKAGRDMMVLCNGCYATLKEAEHIASSDSDVVTAANKRLATKKMKYSGGVGPTHVAQVFAGMTEEIGKSVTMPLGGLKVAVHHGCHILRPAEVMGFDDPFEPSVLEGLLETLGAEVVRYKGYTDCCGKAVRDELVGLELAGDKLSAMEAAGADCVAVVCPACFEQFDLGQVEIKRKLKKAHTLPVFHLCELVALAQGEDAAKLGMERHRTPVKPVTDRLK
jgi:heterodisulfide reductase subunit B